MLSDKTSRPLKIYLWKLLTMDRPNVYRPEIPATMAEDCAGGRLTITNIEASKLAQASVLWYPGLMEVI
jgi:hypothetical protein